MSEHPLEDLTQRVRDSAYTLIGLGILGYQKSQVRRREMAKAGGAQAALAHLGDQLETQLRAVGEAVGPQVAALRPQAEALWPQVEALWPQVEGLLPQAEALGARLASAGTALRPQVETMGATLVDLLESVDQHVEALRSELDATVGEIGDHLSPAARSTVAHLREVASLREQVLRRVFAPGPGSAPRGPATTVTPDSATPDSAATARPDDIEGGGGAAE